MNWKKIAVSVAAAAVLAFGGAYALLLPSADRIADGLHIGDVAVGGMTQEEAKAQLAQVWQQTEKNGVVLELVENDEKTWNVKAGEIDFSVDVDATVERAYEVGRAGGLFARITDAYQARSRNDLVSYAVHYDEEKLKGIINNIRDMIEVKPIEARAEVANGKVVIHPNQTGYLVDTDAVLADVKNMGAQIPHRVSLHTKTIYAAVTTEALADIKDVLGVYTTTFSTAAVGRTTNIRLASQSISGMLMKPNDVFSFNEVVGYRSAERGYQEAPVIVGGKLEPGLGGGICQVSTTLYNAVLLANLGIVERSNHSFPSSYVPIGLDATVSYGSKDFRFRNTRQSDIYLWIRVAGNTITAAVLGNKEKEPVPNLKYYSEVVETIPMPVEKIEDASVPVGTEIVVEKGKNGYASVTYRVENGKSQVAYRDRYPTAKRVVRVNPQKAVHTSSAQNADDAVKTKPTAQPAETTAVPPKPSTAGTGSSALPPRPTTVSE